MENQEQSVETSAEPTLDDVYKEHKIEDVAQSFQQQRSAPIQQPAPPAAPAVATPQIPDPVLDPNGFKQTYAQESTVLRQAVTQMYGQLSALQQREAKAAEERDIKQAVQTVREKGFEADDDLIEIALGHKARQDARFLAIYQQRHQNPKAWNAALGAVANEFKARYAFKTDPQLTENTRAARSSSQTTQTTRAPAGNSIDSLFSGKTGRDFERLWEQVRDQG